MSLERTLTGQEVPSDEERWVGKGLRRFEDGPLLRGQGRYVDDVAAADALHLVFVRSAAASGVIRSIDASAALEMEGVHAVITAADLAHTKGLRATVDRPYFRAVEMPLLARDRVCYAGQAVAIVVADTAYLAEDAADAVAVRIDRLPVVTSIEAALAPDAPTIHDEAPGNTFIDVVAVDDPEIDDLLASADAVIEATFRSGRVTAVPMEARACLAQLSAHDGRLHLYASSQTPHMLRSAIADALRIPERTLHVIAPDVGGGFGQKACIAPEDVLVAAAALHVGRSVKWIEDRRENLSAASQGHEQRTSVRAAFTADGQMLALDAVVDGDVGAYSCYPFTSGVEPMMAARELPGVYRLGHYRVRARAVVTNKPFMAPYRGVGRPQIVHVIERLMDKAARKLGIARDEIRRRNIIRREDFPYTGVNGVTYDEGSYLESLERCLAAVGFEDWERRQQEARDEGRLLGLGFSCFSEFTGYGTASFSARGLWIVPGHETAVVEVDPSGHVSVAVGASSHGQGHRTALAQVVADELGVMPHQVDVLEGDTDIAPYGWGTFASRGAVASGGACKTAAARMARIICEIAAHLLDVPADEVRLGGGLATAGGGDRYLTFAEIAHVAHSQVHRLPDPSQPGLVVRASFDPPGTFSNATHAAVVEIDPKTGGVVLERFVVVEDCGVMLNPTIVDGQVRGGVAQGIAKALYEAVVHDEEGQCLTSTLIDYLVPTAAEIPTIEIHHLETPSRTSPTGAKGMGEGGTIGAPAAIANAVTDAVSHLGVEFDHMPISPADLLPALRGS